jgi:gliding motility-associated-like protein
MLTTINNIFDNFKLLHMKRINSHLGKIMLALLFGLMSSASLMAQTVTYDISATGDPYEGCEDYLINFNATITGTFDSVELWLTTPNRQRYVQHDDWNVSGNNWTIARFFSAGTYNPVLRVKSGGVWQEWTLPKPIRVYSNPVADFAIQNDTSQCFKGNEFCFEDRSKPGAENHTIEEWFLDVGDGFNYKKLPICHEYKQQGDFEVILTVTDEKGCSNSKVKEDYPEVYREIGADFSVRGPVGCPCTDIEFVNKTPFDTALINWWIWDWGVNAKSRDTFYMRGLNSFRILKNGDTLTNYDEWWSGFERQYCKDGYSSPKLVIEANDGCRDSILLKDAIRSINFRFDITWVPDTPCFTDNSITFNMPPRPNATQLQWVFGDPASMQLNVNRESWRPEHVFVGGPGFYNISFSVLEPPCPVRDTVMCFVKLKGPSAAINLPAPPNWPEANNCRDPREIPLDTFERLKYDECYRETSKRTELNYVWVNSRTKSKKDSYFVYCHPLIDSFMFIPGAAGDGATACGPAFTIAKEKAWVSKKIFNKVYGDATPWLWNRDSFWQSGVTIWLEEGESRNYIDTIGNPQVLTPDTGAGFYFVHCREFEFEKGDSIPRNPIVMDSIAIYEAPRGPNDPLIAAVSGFVASKAFTHKWAGLVHYFTKGESRRYVSLDGDTLVFTATNAGFDTLFVRSFEFNVGDTIRYPNGNWRYKYLNYTQSFRPAWEFTDPIPVPDSLVITDSLTPVGGGPKVFTTFSVFAPYLGVHRVNVSGTDYIYRIKATPIRHDGGQYFPPMWPGTHPLSPPCGNEWRTMHDSDKFKIDCKAPNLVTFTNNTTKYRLFGRSRSEKPTAAIHDIDNLSMAFVGATLGDPMANVVPVDSCSDNSNFPWSSDSLYYFWDFGDQGDQCTTYWDMNKDIQVKGQNPSGDPLLCQYSELVAPQHLYIEDGCWTARLTVFDPETGCESQATQPIVMEFPDAGPDNPQGVASEEDVNFYNQQVFQNNEDGDEFRKGLQLGVGAAPCVGNAQNPYFQQINIRETVPRCGRETFWMIFNRDDPHQGANDDPADNDCVKNECTTDGNGKLIENSIKIENRGSGHIGGTYDVEFREVLGSGVWGKTHARGRATIHQLGFLNNLNITENRGGFTDGAKIQMVFSDSSRLGFNPAFDSILVFGYEEIETFWYDCNWIPEMILQLIGMQWTYSTAGCKTPGLRIKVGDCMHTYFYEDYRYFLDANGDFLISPNPRTMAIEEITANRDDAIRPDIVDDVDFVACKEPADTTLLPTKLPYRMTLTVEDYTRNDPNGPDADPVCDALDSIRTFRYVARKTADQCGTYIGNQGYFDDSLDLHPNGYETVSGGHPELVNLRDTLHYTIKSPGKYIISSSARAKHGPNFCFGGNGKEIWLGQHQCFRYTDSILCEGQSVTFYDSVYYWRPDGQIGCELDLTVTWNFTCIDITGFFYHPDSNAKRKEWYINDFPKDYKGPEYKEMIAWDFDAPRYKVENGDSTRMEDWMRDMDSSNIEIWIDPATGTQEWTLPTRDTTIYDTILEPDFNTNSWERPVTWEYGSHPKYGIGIYDVTLWARDSMGCWIPYTKKDAIRVLGVDARFTLCDNCQDTLICTPATVGMRDTSVIIEHNGTAVTKGTNDEVVKWKWKWGDRRDSSLIQHPGHTYLDANEEGYTIRLFVETKQGCKDSLTIPRMVKILGPQANFELLEDSVCVGQEIQFVDKTYSRSDYTAVWTTDPISSTRDAVGKGQDTARSDTVTWVIDQPGEYKVRMQVSSKVRDPLTGVEKDCDDTYPNPLDPKELDIDLMIRAIDKITLTQSDELICPGEEVTFTVDNENTYEKYDSMMWNTGVGNRDSLRLRNQEITQVYDTSGTYTIMLTGTGDFLTCPDTINATVEVKDVKADVEINEALSNEDLGYYTFMNFSENAKYHRWRIYARPDTTNPIAEFVRSDTSRLIERELFVSGEYKIELMVSDFDDPNDPRACIDVDYVDVEVDPKIVVYNIFTPDGDGNNDFWEMELQASPEFEIYIYNRWGELMQKGDQESDWVIYQKESTGSQVYQFWDGTNRNGNGNATAGTYFYVFKYRFKGDEELQTITGSITLVR